jgi:adenosine deaminase
MDSTTKRAKGPDGLPVPRDLKALPKAELHVHLEGAMRPTTLTELCLKHDIPRPEDTRGKRFPNFGAFASTYIAACECLREEDDLFRLVLEVAEDAKASGAWWVEAALSFTFYAPRFGGLGPTLSVLLKAAAEAEVKTGIAIGYIVSAERMFAPDEAEKMAEVVRDMVLDGKSQVHGRPGIIGFGLHADETGNPPDPFAKAFERACVGGVVALPHAGELAPHEGKGPESVRFCVESLKARRIGHGVLAIEDEDLVASLASKAICLDICPTSNYLLSVCKSLEDHPLPTLLRKGVPCTINSDDPLLFGCNLLGEYEVCRQKIGLSDEDIAACARNSFQHSCAPSSLREKGLQAVEEWLAL